MKNPHGIIGNMQDKGTDMCFEDDEIDDDIEELFSIIPDVEGNASGDEDTESEYEDLEDEEFDIDF